MLDTILWFIFAFVLLWIGSGIAVKTISTISHSLAMSSFLSSFFILGFFTSLTEITIGITSLIEGRPEIYVGNLLGSSVVVYLLIIPLVAVLGGGIKLNHTLTLKGIITAVLVGVFPALLTLDNSFGILDAILCIVLYGYFTLTLDRPRELLNKIFHRRSSYRTLIVSFLKLIVAMVFIFIGSHILVVQTPNLAKMLGMSSYIVSILLISIGSNIPEISIAVRSVLCKHKDIAFGNYLGSASLNTLEIGLLTLLGRSAVPANGSNYSVVNFALGMMLFLYFVKRKRDISRGEGTTLLGFYILFIFFEILTGSGWQLFK